MRKLMRVPLLVFLVASVVVACAQGVVTAVPASANPTVPGAPTGVQAVGVKKAIDVSWTAPASNGGSSITGYVVKVTAAGVKQKCKTTTTSCSVTGLTDGEAYSVIVYATNAVGNGPPSTVATATPSTAQNCTFFGPYANLQSCNLASASLSNANLTNANLTDAILTGANLSKAT